VKVAVFGATGATGRQVVRLALAGDHQVTVLARAPGAAAFENIKADVVVGDVRHPPDVAAAIANADAVVSALGVGRNRAATVVYSEGMTNIISAMRAEGVRRLACVSSTAVESAPGTPFALQLLHKQVLQRLLERPFADVREMEDLVGASGLDWTIVRAARLTHGRGRGRYHTASGALAGRGMSISRADLAEYLLICLGDSGTVGRTMEIAY
jgi:uncharacterized protein YbjT (DUF2867 family)